ncbi:MAG: 16S rRNA (adenine(1518)-N(6)/adenine(1519)-N(6))-dimethyltransferase RsmA [Parachlamydiales bacterium]|jgi:16S rRNA (adenine1518-N6/adenine1519-N6)-dimethyltransferase
MPIYRPTELKQFLDSLSTGPKKHLSQNFLIDGNILRKIVTTAKVQKGDVVLEIGPGPGALTECLMEAGARVIAVEKDPILSNALSRLTSLGDLQIFTDDIMKFDMLKHVPPNAKVIANLPYHLTSPILGLLMPHKEIFSSVHVMVQDEVAKRMTSVHGSYEYSALTVFLNYYGKPSYSFKVGRNCFYPAPKVDSAVVSIDLLTPQADIDRETFFFLVHQAFNQRRKMLRASLKETLDSQLVEDALFKIGLPTTSRPENLSIDHWKAFYKILEIPLASAPKREPHG